ncbi:MAG: HAD family hydrolase [Candidatus Micrarchaeia archaeon]|jgi:FMN phosphatase YigB (HAD superfamily)
MKKFTPRVIFFNLEGGVFKFSNIPNIIKQTIKNCRMTCSDNLNEEFDKFCKGQISENEFWKNIKINDINMPRKLVLEKLEYSFDDDFLPLITGFMGKKIGIYGNIPKEWAEDIFTSSGLSSMIQVSILSSDLEEMFPSEKAFDIMKEKIGNVLIIDQNEDNICAAKKRGLNSVLLIRKPIEKCSCLPDVFVPKLIQLEDLIE